MKFNLIIFNLFYDRYNIIYLKEIARSKTFCENYIAQ